MVLTKGSHFCSLYNTKLSFNEIPTCTCFKRKPQAATLTKKLHLMSAIGKHEEMELVPAVNWNHWSRQQIQPGSLWNVYSPLLMLNITCQMNDPLTGLTYENSSNFGLWKGDYRALHCTNKSKSCLENSFSLLLEISHLPACSRISHLCMLPGHFLGTRSRIFQSLQTSKKTVTHHFPNMLNAELS